MQARLHIFWEVNFETGLAQGPLSFLASFLNAQISQA